MEITSGSKVISVKKQKSFNSTFFLVCFLTRISNALMDKVITSLELKTSP